MLHVDCCNCKSLPSSGPNPVDLSADETTFTVDDAGDHSIVIDFLYNSSTIDNLTLTVSDGTVEKTGFITLHDCNEVDFVTLLACPFTATPSLLSLYLQHRLVPCNTL